MECESYSLCTKIRHDEQEYLLFGMDRNIICDEKAKVTALFEPRHEKTGFLPMQKQRHRSASQ